MMKLRFRHRAIGLGLATLGAACAPAATALHRPGSIGRIGTATTATIARSQSAPLALPAPLFTEQELRARLAALTETRNHRLGLVQSPVLLDDGHTALYLAGGPRDPKLALYTYDVVRKLATVLASASTLAGDDSALPEAERKRRERLRITTRGISSFEVSSDGTRVLVTFGGKLFLINRATDETKPLDLKPGVVDPHFSPSGNRIGFVRDNNVWVYDLATHRERAITAGGTEEKSYGLAEFVAQEELDRTRGFWFAPDESEMLVQYTDNSHVEKLVTSDPAAPEAGGEPRYYPRAGKSNVLTAFWRYSLGSAKPKPEQLALDLANFPYVAHVVWPKNGPLAFVALNRAQTDLEVWGIAPHSSKVVRLLHEHDDAWIDAQHTVPAFVKHGSGFVWASEVDADARLSVHNYDPLQTGSELASTRTATFREASAAPVHFAFIDHDDQHLYFFEHDKNGRRTLVFKNFEGATVMSAVAPHPAVPNGTVVLDAKPAESGAAFLSLEASPAGPPAWHVRRLLPAMTDARDPGSADDGILPNQVEAVATMPHWQRVAIGSMHYAAVIVRPSRGIPGQKLPIIDAIYGGPTVNTVSDNGWSYLRQQWIADATGAAVVAIDVEGTPDRGRDFERAAYKHFGSLPLAKHVEAIKALAASEPDLDDSRVGIYGWSFGGYLAARAALEYPTFFRTAVSGAPPVDWRDYDTCYTERYLGVPMPARTPAGEREQVGPSDDPYARESLLNLASAPGPIAPLLIFHGTRDDNVYFAQSLKLVDALFRANKPFQFVPLKNTTHLLYEPALTAAVWQKTAAFLRAGLGDPNLVPAGK